MTKFTANGRGLKTFVAIGAMLSGLAIAQPALSAQSDLDRVQSYVGVWHGSGKLTDAEGNNETLRCRITFAKSSAEIVTMNGNCTGAGMGKQSLTGALGLSKRSEQI